MIANLARVRPQPRRPHVVVRGVLRVEERLERCLRVYDDLFAARQMDDQVGPLAAVIAREGRLLVEIAPLHHAGHLDHAAELHLAPAPADRRGPQRLRQGVRRGAESGDLFRQAGIGRDAIALGFRQTLVHLLQRLGDRLLKTGERRLREIEKRGSIVLERVGGQRLERVAQLHFGFLEERFGGERAAFRGVTPGARARDHGSDHRTERRGHRGEYPFHGDHFGSDGKCSIAVIPWAG